MPLSILFSFIETVTKKDIFLDFSIILCVTWIIASFIRLVRIYHEEKSTGVHSGNIKTAAIAIFAASIATLGSNVADKIGYVYLDNGLNLMAGVGISIFMWCSFFSAQCKR